MLSDGDIITVVMNVSVARVFFKPSDIGKEPEAFLNTFESPATVELGLCFLLLILSSIFTTLELRVQTVVGQACQESGCTVIVATPTKSVF